MEVKINIPDYRINEFDNLVAEAAAKKLIEPIKECLEELIHERVFEIIDESVGQILAGVIENPIQKTNSWGEPVGGTMTLREVILKQGIEWFNQPVDYQGKPVGRCDKGEPRANHIAKKVIDEHIMKDIKKEAYLIRDLGMG